MHSISIKHQLLNKCKEYIDLRIATAKQSMDNAQQAANQEEKSSAGDKYETGRTMMQIERDFAAQQLNEALKLRAILDHISPDPRLEKVSLGSLVTADSKKIFISIGIGKLNVNGTEFLIVAPTSPLGKVLAGLKVNDKFTFNKELLTILEIS